MDAKGIFVDERAAFAKCRHKYFAEVDGVSTSE